MGDPDWMAQLVGLMRGGVSLQSLAQSKDAPPADKDGWQEGVLSARLVVFGIAATMQHGLDD